MSGKQNKTEPEVPKNTQEWAVSGVYGYSQRVTFEESGWVTTTQEAASSCQTDLGYPLIHYFSLGDTEQKWGPWAQSNSTMEESACLKSG